MAENMLIYNTLTRQKEVFKPINAPFVGMYVCGPTVYNDVHLGNCRTFISFDLIFRYLKHSGFKVRYVRNITDAGHLEGDRDEGEDKFAKKAKLEQLEPMEIVQKYTVGFHAVLQQFNCLPPSIEPTATGHICEQIEMVKQIIEKGFAYEVNGTVYFDVEKYTQSHNYGQLSNRNLDDLMANTRELGGQDDKKGRLDFALWIKAKPEHLMRWPSPWGWGFPGWHIECSAMSTKYLGETFDIHGGGMDLVATHHSNEVAQSQACNHTQPANYWMHTNMLTVNGARMSKSAGNGFLPGELFTGNHPLLVRGFSPMVVRFFMMQTHYRSTLDFSNEALVAAEKGFERLMSAIKRLQGIVPAGASAADTGFSISQFEKVCNEAMQDDFNSPILIAQLFDGVRFINAVADGKATVSAQEKDKLVELYHQWVFDVLGLKAEQEASGADDFGGHVMDAVVEIRKKVREKKDFATSDLIRDELKKINIIIKDTKDGAVWEHEK